MRRNKQLQQLERLAPDVNHNRWVQHWRNQRCRYMPKMTLSDGETGRTHKRKPRGTRKVKNMGWRQYMKHMFDIGEW